MRYHIWLTGTAKLTCDKACKLLSVLGTAKAVFDAPVSRLRQYVNITDKEKHGLENKDLSYADRVIAKCREIGVQIVTFCSEKYPKRVKDSFMPPVVLYVRGTLPDIDNIPLFAVVGSRRPTRDSKAFAERISYQLTSSGMTVISGMADGVDTSAAEGALKAGSTLAVLGTAIDNPYPRYNSGLYREIIKNGAVISEYPPGEKTFPSCFVERNRIIAAMSIGVLVIEAGSKSGSLSTARFAEEYGRYVFVSPGLPTDVNWAGSHQLLRSGAFYTVSAEDILSQYDSIYSFNKYCNAKADFNKIVDRLSGLSDNERRVYQALSNDMRADELAAACAMGAGEMSSLLTVMELSGLIEQTASQLYRRK